MLGLQHLGKTLAGYDTVDFCQKLAAVHAFNGGGDKWGLPHLLMRRALQYPRGTSRIPTPVLMRLYEEFLHLDSRDLTDEEPDMQDRDMLRAGAKLVSTPGPVGQMLLYFDELHRPQEALFQSKLGFSPEEGVQSIRRVQFRLSRHLRSYGNSDPWFEARAFQGVSGERLLTPSRGFIENWLSATSLPLTDVIERGGTIRSNVLDVITADVSQMSHRGRSFGRYAFVRVDGQRILLAPYLLVDAFVFGARSAIQATLTDAEIGEFGNRLGWQFEKMVRVRIQRYAGTSVQHRRQHSKGDDDIRFEVEGKSVVIQCKSRPIKPEGIWHKPEIFKQDFRRNVAEAARQLQISCSGGTETYGGWLVLDTLFVGLATAISSDPVLRKLFEGVPRPAVFSFWDLDYLLRKIPAADLLAYLDWRETAAKSGVFQGMDEFDLVRFYLKGPKIDLERMASNENTILWNGYDPDEHAYWLGQFDSTFMKG